MTLPRLLFAIILVFGLSNTAIGQTFRLFSAAPFYHIGAISVLDLARFAVDFHLF